MDLKVLVVPVLFTADNAFLKEKWVLKKKWMMIQKRLVMEDGANFQTYWSIRFLGAHTEVGVR